MKHLLRQLRAIPRWGWVFGIGLILFQYSFYLTGSFLSGALGTAAHALVCKIPAIDDRIPLLPVFVLVYVYSYPFWICGAAAVSLTGKRNFVNFLCGITLAYLIGFLFFVFLPTRMDRTAEGLLEGARKADPWVGLLRLVYAADGSTVGFNLFPSFHCLSSAFCWLGVRGRPEISRGFRLYSLVMALLISASTVLTKQHYFIDIPGGWALALLCWLLMQRLDPGSRWKARFPGIADSR